MTYCNMTSCLHAASQDIKPPTTLQPVYREDCTQCFDSIDDKAGLNVCLTCFNGGCVGDRNHASLHFERFGHPLALNIKRSRKKPQRDEPPQKISKLAITAESEEDLYETVTNVICYACSDEKVDVSLGNLTAAVEGVMSAMTFSKKEEVKAWEQEFIPCEHTLCLEQQEAKQVGSQDICQCSMCDLKQNLWLCLECGNLGCGRSQFGGLGGNSHALAHSDMSAHGVAVKLGSITADGSADIYCYKCNEERVDPNLAEHLSHWGINLAGREKTEKSLMEMQVEQNLKWDFSTKAEDGHELTPLFGAGLTGLINLGNSCYLSSVVQCIFDIPEFQHRYYQVEKEPPFARQPAEDLETQMRKLADGLLSGRYSLPDDTTTSAQPSEAPYQKGLAPAMFKYLVGRGHEEFSTMRQQDAFEFLTHIFKLVGRSKHTDSHPNPIDSFSFIAEQRLQCMRCRKIRYREDKQDNISIPVPARRSSAQGSDATASVRFCPVSLQECLEESTAEERVELNCPSCGSKDGFTRQASFKTLPQHLVINARRFELINWVPTKLDIPVEVSEQPLDFSPYLSSGPQDGEELLPNDDAADHKDAFIPNPESLEQLMAMGFPKIRCDKALLNTGNGDAESAMNWIFAHMDDPDIDAPLSHQPNDSRQSVDVDPGKLAMLGDMGIEAAHAKAALAATGGDVNRAIDWVFSHPDEPIEINEDAPTISAQGTGSSSSSCGFDSKPALYQLRSIVCHKGSSVHAGHYVAFVRKKLPGQDKLSWVMFNDEKVVSVEEIQDMKKFAYVYFFSRI